MQLSPGLTSLSWGRAELRAPLPAVLMRAHNQQERSTLIPSTLPARMPPDGMRCQVGDGSPHLLCLETLASEALTGLWERGPRPPAGPRRLACLPHLEGTPCGGLEAPARASGQASIGRVGPECCRVERKGRKPCTPSSVSPVETAAIRSET